MLGVCSASPLEEPAGFDLISLPTQIFFKRNKHYLCLSDGCGIFVELFLWNQSFNASYVLSDGRFVGGRCPQGGGHRLVTWAFTSQCIFETSVIRNVLRAVAVMKPGPC